MKGIIYLLLCIIACHSCFNEKADVNQIIDEISKYENQVKDTLIAVEIKQKSSTKATISNTMPK